MRIQSMPGLFGAALLLAGGVVWSGAAAAPSVVATIKPVQSLVAGVMSGVGTPHLLIPGDGSPHTFSLRPSDARALSAADLVFWIGPDLETFLVDPVRKLAPNADVIALMDAPGLTLLPVRAGASWSAHDHGHDDHGQGKHDHGKHDHGKHDHGKHDQGHAGHGHAGHDNDETDAHVWLDPANAKAMVAAIAAALRAHDPDNAAIYAANAAALTGRLYDLAARMQSDLEPVRDRPFVLFHDAFQYLEARFGLHAVGSITISPDRRPGAERLTELRRTIRESAAVCIFSEPQFEPALVQVVAEGTAVRIGALDPLGAALQEGPDLYFTLMEGNAAALRDCLAPPA